MRGSPVAVSVLTGFLGAGKTTLLNRLLKEPGLTDTAVIINEFGDVAIDHLLVERSSDGIIQMADGCLCCSVRGELVDTLADLVERQQTGQLAALRRVIIETTGLADPAPVLQSIMTHPTLVEAYRLDGVITLVDAVNGAATLDAHLEAVKQVGVADRLVLSKADLVEDSGRIATLRARLRAINPSAPILEASSGSAAAASLFECGVYDPKTKTADIARWLGGTVAPAERETPHGHGHEHHARDHRHDARLRTFSLRHDKPVPYCAIEMFLDLLRSAQGDRLLRMKGVVELAEDRTRPLVIHGVQKVLHPPAWLPRWPDAGRGTRLVLITLDMPEEFVRRLFAAVTAQPSIDTPDLAALESNPLAIPGRPKEKAGLAAGLE